MAVTRTVVTQNPNSVSVAVSAGQFLHFMIEAVGPVPIFSFASDVKGTLYQAPDFMGHPMGRYEWLHDKNPSDFQQMETLTIGLAFLTNGGYTFTVELRDAGNVISTVLKITYTGAPTDVENESFTLVLL